MMNDAASLTRRNLCRTDVELFINLKRVATDDFTFELTRNSDPEIALARSSRPDNGYQALHRKSQRANSVTRMKPPTTTAPTSCARVSSMKEELSGSLVLHVAKHLD